MLSLCMIVRNEEENIERCLKSAKKIVDEIIIIDTGSTDVTKKICFGYTDKIYDFEWNDNFAEARNFSISKASNDWVLILDADEEVIYFNKESILRFIRNKSNDKIVGRIKRINFMDDNKGLRKYSERVNRMFNKNYFCYKGTIHEQIDSKSGEDYNTELIDISVEHGGYLKGNMSKKDKLTRNINLLNKEIEKNLEDPYLFFQLGKSYYMLREFEKACKCFEKSLEFDLDFRLEYVEDLIETYGYSLVEDGKYNMALRIKDYGKYYNNSSDFIFLLGIIYMNNAMFSDAVQCFDTCTKFKECKVEGVTTFLSYYNIGVVYEVLGYKTNAVEYYKLCGNYENALERLKAIN